MQIIFDSHGIGSCVYDEVIPLEQIGRVSIRRGSHVEPDESGNWLADLSPVGGPVLGPFPNRSAALNAERLWLEEFWLTRQS